MFEFIRTVREIAYSKFPGLLCQILERDVRLPLSYHQVDDYERLEDDGPGRVVQAVLERTEDFGDTGFASVRCDEDMFYILGLGRRELETNDQQNFRQSIERLIDLGGPRTLIFVPPLTDFSKEEDIACCDRGGRCLDIRCMQSE